MQQAVDAALAQIHAKQKGYVVTPNAEIAYACLQDAQLHELVNHASLVLPDGIGVVYAARILGQPIPQKVAGIEFADALLAALAKEKGSVFLLGAKPGIAQQAAQKLQEKHQGLVIAGCQDGYFQDDAQAVAAINDAGGADVVFVCLGAPKQERFMAAHQDEIHATLLCGLGGSLDVFAGTVQRAPDIFIKLGLEWFYRLLKQPQRIGRMLCLPKFMLRVFQEKLFGRKRQKK